MSDLYMLCGRGNIVSVYLCCCCCCLCIVSGIAFISMSFFFFFFQSSMCFVQFGTFRSIFEQKKILHLQSKCIWLSLCVCSGCVYLVHISKYDGIRLDSFSCMIYYGYGTTINVWALNDFSFCVNHNFLYFSCPIGFVGLNFSCALVIACRNSGYAGTNFK